MGDIYLIVGKEFRSFRNLNALNIALASSGLIADPTDYEKQCEDQYAPKNIRKITDPEGTPRLDFIRIEEDSLYRLIVGRIQGRGSRWYGKVWPAAAALEEILEARMELIEYFADPAVYATYACLEDVQWVSRLTANEGVV